MRRREVIIFGLLTLALVWAALGRKAGFSRSLWELGERVFELSPPCLIALWWGLVILGLVGVGFLRLRVLVWFGAVALGYLGLGRLLLGWW